MLTSKSRVINLKHEMIGTWKRMLTVKYVWVEWRQLLCSHMMFVFGEKNWEMWLRLWRRRDAWECSCETAGLLRRWGRRIVRCCWVRGYFRSWKTREQENDDKIGGNIQARGCTRLEVFSGIGENWERIVTRTNYWVFTDPEKNRTKLNGGNWGHRRVKLWRKRYGKKFFFFLSSLSHFTQLSVMTWSSSLFVYRGKWRRTGIIHGTQKRQKNVIWAT